MADTEFVIATSALVTAAVSQGWTVQATDRVIKFVSPVGHVAFMSRQGSMFAQRTLADMRARLTREGLVL